MQEHFKDIEITIIEQQHRIQTLEEESYNSKNLLRETKWDKIMDAEASERKEQDDELQSLIDSIIGKPR